jgi:dolichyl-phosphate-mannose-protein mannosyltransferase
MRKLIKAEKIIPFGLILLGLLSRLLFIWWPAEVVFDEVHFGKFVNAYFSGEYYFDIHPPLGKLLVWLTSSFLGYQGTYEFLNIGDPYPNRLYIALRFLPAVAGGLIPFALYFFLRSLRFSTWVAGFASALALFDNALLVQSHIILVDAFLLLFGFLGLAFFFFARQSQYKLAYHLLLASLFLALSLSVKWTGIGFWLVAGFTWAWDIGVSTWQRKRLDSFASQLGRAILFLGVLPLLIYFLVFFFHFSLLPKSGPGDPFMTAEFLRGEKNILEKFSELNRRMYSANASLSATHLYGSKFYTWPFMTRPVYYWVKSFADGETARIYFLGNPIVWWFSFAGLIAALFFWKPKSREKKTLLFLGYGLNLLLFAPIDRVVFLYHYLAALLFSISIFAGWFLESWEARAYTKKTSAILLATLLLVILSFLFFAPLSYGFPLSEEAYRQRVWFSSWI